MRETIGGGALMPPAAWRVVMVLHMREICPCTLSGIWVMCAISSSSKHSYSSAPEAPSSRFFLPCRLASGERPNTESFVNGLALLLCAGSGTCRTV